MRPQNPHGPTGSQGLCLAHGLAHLVPSTLWLAGCITCCWSGSCLVPDLRLPAMDAYASMDSEFFLNNRVHGPHSVGNGDKVQVVQECDEVLAVAQLFLDRLQSRILHEAEEQWHHRVMLLRLEECCALFWNHLPTNILTEPRKTTGQTATLNSLLPRGSTRATWLPLISNRTR